MRIHSHDGTWAFKKKFASFFYICLRLPFFFNICLSLPFFWGGIWALNCPKKNTAMGHTIFLTLYSVGKLDENERKMDKFVNMDEKLLKWMKICQYRRIYEPTVYAVFSVVHLQRNSLNSDLQVTIPQVTGNERTRGTACYRPTVGPRW